MNRLKKTRLGFVLCFYKKVVLFVEVWKASNISKKKKTKTNTTTHTALYVPTGAAYLIKFVGIEIAFFLLFPCSAFLLPCLCHDAACKLSKNCHLTTSRKNYPAFLLAPIPHPALFPNFPSS